MKDVYLFDTPDGGEIEISDFQIQMRDTADSAAYISLFGGNVEDDGSRGNSNSWWGNLDTADKYVSRTQYLLLNKVPTPQNMKLIREAAINDLAWMIDSGVADTVDATVTMPTLKRLQLEVFINGVSTFIIGSDDLEVYAFPSSVIPPNNLKYRNSQITGNSIYNRVIVEIYNTSDEFVYSQEVSVLNEFFVLDIPSTIPNGYYKSSAYAINQEGERSANSETILFLLNYFSAPFNISAEYNINGIALAWEVIGSGVAYDIYRSITPIDTSVQMPLPLAQNIQIRAFLDDLVDPSVARYYYVIAARSGEDVRYSENVPAYTFTPPYNVVLENA